MPTVQRLPLDAFVVGTAFLGEVGVFALGDGTVRILEGSAADEVRVHDGAVLATAATLDGKGLVTGGDDGIVAVTDAAGTVERVAECPRKWIDQVAAGPDGAVAFSVGRDAVVRLSNGTEKVFSHDRSVTGIAFAPKGLRIAAAGNNSVALWFVNSDAPAIELKWSGPHIAVTFSPDNRFVVTAMQENALHGWKIPDGAHLRMTGYPAKPRSFSWSAKGRFLATSGADAAILWPFHFKDGPQGKQPLQIGARDSLVTRVACHPYDDAVAIGYRDGALALGPFDEGEGQLLRPAGDGPVSALAWDATGRRLAFGTEEGAAGVIDFAG